MVKQIDIKIHPDHIHDREKILRKINSKKLFANIGLEDFRIIRKSIDARGRIPLYVLRIEVSIDEEPSEKESYQIAPIPILETSKRAVIIGAGPAGYFAALELLKLGIKPIIYERGKDVRSRRRDLRQIQQFSIVDPDSNYCFGEGGAGTYSDGKLYTRSKKRGDVNKVLSILIEHGASTQIGIDAHPHIGSNKLPKIIENIRKKILELGGEVHFESKLVELKKEGSQLAGCRIGDELINTDALILATGHSARDIFNMLYKQSLRLEFKDFALGVRVEHPQALIDEIQYHQKIRHENLPAASYSLACQVEDKGVFSFCMCPGGMIVPAATSPGEIVLNGMSLSKRDSVFANAGVVTSLDSNDVGQRDDDPFAGLIFQQKIEQNLFKQGDGSQKAPTQKLTDFMNGKLSADLNKSSYIPGIYSAPLHELLPKFIAKRLRRGILTFDKRMKGYYTDEANILAVESRTSSPIRIPRNSDTLMHPDLNGLFPCGEGGGYAGGIMSAALDGQRVAQAVSTYLKMNI